MMRTDLTTYNAAKKALAEAIRIDDVKDIRDKAAAMRLYALQAKDRVLIDQATEIRLRAERRCGELLRDMANRGERHRRGDSNQHAKSQAATLQNLDINKSQSSRWQKLSDLEEGDFEELVARAKQKACGAVDKAQQPKPKPEPKSKLDDAAIFCVVVKVETIVRAAMSGRDSEERGHFVQLITEALRRVLSDTAKAERDAGVGRGDASPNEDNIDKSQKNFEDDEAEHNYEEVEDPAVIKSSLLNTIERHCAVINAYRKVRKVSSFDRGMKEEISSAIDELIKKWRSFQSTLSRPLRWRAKPGGKT